MNCKPSSMRKMVNFFKRNLPISKSLKSVAVETSLHLCWLEVGEEIKITVYILEAEM